MLAVPPRHGGVGGRTHAGTACQSIRVPVLGEPRLRRGDAAGHAGDRDAPGFRALFPDGLTERIRHALARQLVVAAELVDTLSLRHFDDAFRAKHVPALQAAIENGRAALEARRKAELARTEARLDVQAWKEEANALLLAAYSQLLALAARERRGRAWAEAFFLGESSHERGAAEPETPAEPVV